MAYCTLAELKQYLGISATTDDSLLMTFIDMGKEIIDRHVGFVFTADANTTRYLDAEADVDGDTLYLDTWCYSITTLTNGDSTTVTSTQYNTLPVNGDRYYAIQLKPSAGISWTYTTDHEKAISVTGRHAYGAIAPRDIAYANVRLAAWMYRAKDNASDADRAVLTNVATIAPMQLPADVIAILDAYAWRT